jgi:fatty-acyl-CoA synthase
MFTEHRWIMRRASISPNKIALVDIHTDEKWTFGKLEERILRWATFFTTKGLKKGERIAILSPNSSELFAVLFACQLKGLIYVPLNWRLSRFELSVLLNDCTPSCLLFHEQFEETIHEINYPNSLPLQSIHSLATEQIAVNSEQLHGTDPWMIIYTGGTTGKPKGVVISYNAVNWNAMNTIISWGLTEFDTTISYMPLFHTGGINALSMPLLMAGGTVVIGNKFEAEEALEATDRYKATISLFVPTMYQAMLNSSTFDDSEYPSMKVFLSGGAPCPETIYTKFHQRGLHFKEGYGLTEAGPNNFYIRPEDSCEKIGSVGKPMLYNEVKVVNKEGSLCGIDEVGELYIKGPHVFSQYWENQIETDHALQNGWLRTGDLAKYDKDNDYYIVGRVKDIIISGGENIYPQEIEQCLIHLENIMDAAVVGRKDDKWGEAIIAFITVEDEKQFNLEKVINHCKKFLGNYKIPKEIIVLEDLPKTHVGKIDKNALLQMSMNIRKSKAK